MNAADAARLVTLAAIWGASFLFMRIAAPAIGPVATADVRMLIAGGPGRVLRSHRIRRAVAALVALLPLHRRAQFGGAVSAVRVRRARSLGRADGGAERHLADVGR